MNLDFKKDLLNVYNEAAKLIDNYNHFPLKELKSEQFKPTLIAAFIKCFEFNLDINGIEENRYAFYFTSFLRRICEDLISLKFISKFEETERSNIINAYNLFLLNTSVRSQINFFDKEKPFQPIIRTKNIESIINSYELELNKIWEGHGYRKDKVFPSVEHMAIDSKLKLLYDFLYHATSKAVYFSPNVLLRTGWYKDENGPIVFTTNNFSSYYSLFNSFYGTFLFVQYVKSFKKILGITKDFSILITQLEKILEDVDHFPEIVTFEEMNIKRPSGILYKILEMASKMDKEEKKEFIAALPEILKEVKKKIEE